VAADQARFRGTAEMDLTPFNEVVRPFGEAWNTKYGAAFDIDNPAAVFRPIAKIEPAGRTDDVQRAAVVIEAAEGMPEFRINMIKDTTWHLDVPDSYDRQSLRDALVRHLTTIREGSANWPPDSLAAQRTVARHVLAAISNTSMVGATQTETPGGAGQ
jgi:hypothetical protein